MNATETTGTYTLSLHDALPIWEHSGPGGRHPTPSPRPGATPASHRGCAPNRGQPPVGGSLRPTLSRRSEEHTSELQSQSNLVCRLLLEKKNLSCEAYCLSGGKA